MSDGAEQDKSEQATPFKLARARRKGTVARGPDLALMSGMAAFTAFAWLAGGQAAVEIGRASQNALISAGTISGGSAEMLTVLGSVLSALARPVLFAAAVVFVVVLVLEIIQTGPVFSTATLSPDFNRLNPAANLKRYVSPKRLAETVKNLLKILVYGGLALAFLLHVYRDLAASIVDARSLARAMGMLGLRLMVLFVAAAALFAIADQILSRREFAKNMRMSRRELQREIKEREGDPRQKQKRKQLHSEFSKLSRSLKGVGGADVIITNPVHYAVALKYDPRTMAAPKVVSRGAHRVALELRRLAVLYGVTVVEDPPLARALYKACDLGGQIPEAQYQAVADIYLEMRRKAQARRLEGPGV